MTTNKSPVEALAAVYLPEKAAESYILYDGANDYSHS